MFQIQVDYALKETETEVISQGLSDFNTPFFGNQQPMCFAVYLRDTHSQVQGGILAWMRPGIKLLCIDTIWLPEELRHHGYGNQLMLAAEAEGLRNGCTHSQLETLPFQAEQFYQQLGYKRIGVIEKMYGEHDSIIMRKMLR
ncbi:MAG: GNAT family N-acetyltransferase [Parachlamydia sp.]|nr:GNAT family N-acetyltransferase [Parachlamydia sp.]